MLGALPSCYCPSAAQMSTSFGHVGLFSSCCSLQIQRFGGSLAARLETASYSSCPPTVEQRTVTVSAAADGVSSVEFTWLA